jgi:hypothetical protein
MYGSVRGAEGNLRPYRDPGFPCGLSRVSLVIILEILQGLSPICPDAVIFGG